MPLLYPSVGRRVSVKLIARSVCNMAPGQDSFPSKASIRRKSINQVHREILTKSIEVLRFPQPVYVERRLDFDRIYDTRECICIDTPHCLLQHYIHASNYHNHCTYRSKHKTDLDEIKKLCHLHVFIIAKYFEQI